MGTEAPKKNLEFERHPSFHLPNIYVARIVIPRPMTYWSVRKPDPWASKTVVQYHDICMNMVLDNIPSAEPLCLID